MYQILRVQNGEKIHTISESNTILRYVGKMAGYYPWFFRDLTQTTLEHSKAKLLGTFLEMASELQILSLHPSTTHYIKIKNEAESYLQGKDNECKETKSFMSFQ